ncbi:MAG TPA: AbrB/MazE/SpoVT family DNA-binding domain-containing protein [Candidatus Hydrogenedentes bacterium]|nr:AbrB/MazE/SpoVT family DNA-binding domain-containing protein [Candidatus Hydrogenedentota bacterium]HNT86249.1 AbrB/MazE/SpoVT family DNA-binding domain-containing protein [Candidatus Hydrogenedentota bacterium]
MKVATVSAKGQITLPLSLRKQLGIEPHERVVLEAAQDAIVVRKAPDFFALEGCFGKRVSPAKERAAMLDAVVRRTKGVRE